MESPESNPNNFEIRTTGPNRATFDREVLSPYYNSLEFIGEGAYGCVVKAKRISNDRSYAIKKIDGFSHSVICQRTYREIVILLNFNHENVIDVKEILSQNGENIGKGANLTEIYVVQECMDTDLHKLLQQQVLSEQHIMYFLYQILRGLKYIHSANVLHRDSKPSNLLISASCDLKICDFGLARIADEEVDHSGNLTEYVATRWYRAPDIMLNARNYTKKIDVWAVGCIFAEMITNTVLFPGRDYMEQLRLIVLFTGSPTEQEISEISNESARRYVVNHFTGVKPVDLHEKFGRDFMTQHNWTNQSLDLLKKLLDFSPIERISTEDALAHEIFNEDHSDLANLEDEPVAERPFTFDQEVANAGAQGLKMKIFELCGSRPEVFELSDSEEDEEEEEQ